MSSVGRRRIIGRLRGVPRKSNPNKRFTTLSLWRGRHIRLSSEMFGRPSPNIKKTDCILTSAAVVCGFIILLRLMKREEKSRFWTSLTHGKMFVVEGEDNNRSEVMILSGQKTNCYVWIWIRGDNISQQWKNWVNRETVAMPKGLLRVHTRRRDHVIWVTSDKPNCILWYI